MRRRFFVDRFDAGSASLHGESAEHLGRVLRAQPGQLYELSDGQRVWVGRVEHVADSKRGASRVDFTLVEPVPAREDPLSIQLLLSLVKFDRFEWCLEKATELGASSIIPTAAARSDKALVAAAERRASRWKKIVAESAQQARRLRPPEILAARDARTALAQCTADCKFLLSERRDAASIRLRLGGLRGAGTAALAVGPEGGWTDEEFQSARENGFMEVSLGDNILRTETAVIASLAILRLGIETDDQREEISQ